MKYSDWPVPIVTTLENTQAHIHEEQIIYTCEREVPPELAVTAVDRRGAPAAQRIAVWLSASIADDNQEQPAGCARTRRTIPIQGYDKPPPGCQ